MSIRTWLRDTVFAFGKRLIAPFEIRRYLASEPHPRLNIGCGGNRVPGWLNADRFPPPGATFVDAAQRLPFADSTFDAVLCEHMIEHVSKPAAIQLLGEMRRIVRPGGIVRVVTPDLAWLSGHILAATPAPATDEAYRDFLRSWHQQEVSWCDAVNLCFYEHGHRYIWSPDELHRQMRIAGFVDLVATRAGQPEALAFAGAEGHAKVMGEVPNALEAFAIEGRVSPGPEG